MITSTRISKGLTIFVLVFITAGSAGVLYFVRPPVFAWIVFAVSVPLVWIVTLRAKPWLRR
jgi:hypothetical protein